MYEILLFTSYNTGLCEKEFKIPPQCLQTVYLPWVGGLQKAKKCSNLEKMLKEKWEATNRQMLTQLHNKVIYSTLFIKWLLDARPSCFLFHVSHCTVTRHVFFSNPASSPLPPTITCKFLKDWDVVIITDTLPWTQAIFMSESINDKI